MAPKKIILASTTSQQCGSLVCHLSATLFLITRLTTAMVNASPSEPTRSSAIIISTIDGQFDKVINNFVTISDLPSHQFCSKSPSGIIYTLDAYHGTLRGMVQSGPPLVSSSKTSLLSGDKSGTNKKSDDNDLYYDNAGIIPGLDGKLYSYADRLTQFPLTISDIINTGPIFACEDDIDDNPEHCGLMTGQTKKKLIALDINQGSIAWMHHEGSLLKVHDHLNKSYNRNTVLLQREDSDVRQIDVSDGKERWKVNIGSIKALDFQRKRSESHGNGMKGVVSGSFMKGINKGQNGQLLQIQPQIDINSPTVEGLFEQPFPSVAFGDDGLTIFCVDGTIRNNILWSKRFESVIANVYGVGGDSTFVDLNVLGSDDGWFGHQHSGASSSEIGVGMYPGMQSLEQEKVEDQLIPYTGNAAAISTSLSFMSLDTKYTLSPNVAILPLRRGRSQYHQHALPTTESVDNHVFNHVRIRKHQDTFFATSAMKTDGATSFLPAQKLETDSNEEYKEVNYLSNNNMEEDAMNSIQDIIRLYQQRLGHLKISHKTQHGLFLTWGMVTLLVACIALGVIGGRFLYVKKKRHWISQSSPALQPNNHFHSVTIGELTEGSPKVEIQKMHTQEEKVLPSSLVTTTHMIKSASLPEMNFHSISSKDDSNGFSRVSEGRCIAEHHISTSHVIPSTPLPPLSSEGVHNIDGIPLVRYSRYKSEFNEISPLGKGGFGTVFKVTNALDGREYAVKKVLIRSYVDANGQHPVQFSQKLQKVLREVKILALLDHANIVRYYTAWLEVEEDDGIVADKCSPLSTIGCEKNSRQLSNSLLVDSSTFDAPSNPFGDENKVSRPQHSHNNSFLQKEENPLGWNTFVNDSSELNELPSMDTVFKRSSQFERQTSSSSVASEYLGFSWDRSNAEKESAQHRGIFFEGLKTVNDDGNPRNSFDSHTGSSSNNSSSSSSSRSSSSSSRGSGIDSESNWSTTNGTCTSRTERMVDTIRHLTDTPLAMSECKRKQKHVLYIQMQLSKKTLLDYFHLREGKVNIPSALRMFGHIVRGVKYVHGHGLIHRDLKPSNCFMDDSDVVKIGDFGLSRESGSQNDNLRLEISTQKRGDLGHDQDNTVGVGTSSYASPEQMNGSDYDSSSDVYSLGIILFELCYPMETRMERFKAFEGIRQTPPLVFPAEWYRSVAKQFPSIHLLIEKMLSHDAKTRPTAAEVAHHIESLISEYTVLSLDSTRAEGSIFLRVEAEDNEGILARTTKVIKEATSSIQILQYSLRAKDSKAIMEFALSATNCKTEVDNDISHEINFVLSALENSSEVTVARKIHEIASLPRQQEPCNKRALSM